MSKFKDQKTVFDEFLRTVFPFLDKEYNWKLVTKPEEIFEAGKSSLDELVAGHTEAIKGFLSGLTITSTI